MIFLTLVFVLIQRGACSRKSYEHANVIKYVERSLDCEWNEHAENGLKLPYSHYEIDLFNGETVEIDCPQAQKEGTTLDPIHEGMFYSSPYIRYDEGVQGDGCQPFTRFKEKLSELPDQLEVENLGAHGSWRISFTGEPKQKQIRSIHFDCLIDSGYGARLHKTSIQINIMPVPGRVPVYNAISLKGLSFGGNSNKFYYYKQARFGEKLDVFCRETLEQVYGVKPVVKPGVKQDNIDLTRLLDKTDMTKRTFSKFNPEYTINRLHKTDFIEAPLIAHDKFKPWYFILGRELYVSETLVRINRAVVELSLEDNNQSDLQCASDEGNVFFLSEHLQAKVHVMGFTNTMNKKERESTNVGMLLLRRVLIFNYNQLSNVYPSTCPKQAIMENGNVVMLRNHINGLKFIGYSTAVSLFDPSRYYSYRKHILHCRYVETWVPNLKVIVTDQLKFEFPPACEFREATSLAPDGKTCTVFLSQQDKLTVRGFVDLKGRSHEASTFLSKNAVIKVENQEGSCDDCFRNVPNEKGMEASWDTVYDELVIWSTAVPIKVNPLYYATSTDSGEPSPKDTLSAASEHGNATSTVNFDQEASAPFRAKNVIEIYRFDTAVIPKVDGTLGKVDNKVISTAKSFWAFFSVSMHGLNRLRLSCKDFFEDAERIKLKLYPEGKNTIFSNVSNGLLDPKKMEVVELQREFATYGLSLYKKPETLHGYDLEVVLDEERGIWGERIKPLYFICAAEDWSPESGSYAIIALDPHFSTEPIYGCGTKPGIFYDNDKKRNQSNRCKFTLNEDRKVGFFCPTPIPKHFLEGEQQQWAPKPTLSSMINPYAIMVRCYRNVPKKRTRKFVDLELFSPPKEVGEVRSLWLITEKLLMKDHKHYLRSIYCNCYDEKGKVTARIEVTTGLPDVE